jgi:hypothetical protein
MLVKVKVTSRIQKTGGMGNQLQLNQIKAAQTYVLLKGAHRIFVQADHLGQSESEPLAVFLN